MPDTFQTTILSADAKVPQTPQATKTDISSKPKRALSDFPECPPDHWIYKQGPQIGFVCGLPQPTKGRHHA
jgi:hypothetical protein